MNQLIVEGFGFRTAVFKPRCYCRENDTKEHCTTLGSWGLSYFVYVPRLYTSMILVLLRFLSDEADYVFLAKFNTTN